MYSCEKLNPIEIIRGTTNPFGIELIEKESGQHYELEEGQSLIFGVKMNEHDEYPVITKKITRVVDGSYYLELTPNDTKFLEPGHYYYDIGLKISDSAYFNIVEPSPFVIKANITSIGDVE